MGAQGSTNGGRGATIAVMVRRIALISLALFGVILGAAWMTPDRWRVEWSIEVQAPPELIWQWVSAPSRWPEWTPWNRDNDPGFAYEHFGGTDGYGSGYRWSSPGTSGELRIIDSEPMWRLRLAGELEDRFPVTGTIELVPLDDGRVRVVWSEEGELGWDPLLRLFRPMLEKHLRLDFAAGLNRLKELAEAEVKRDPPTPDPHFRIPTVRLLPEGALPEEPAPQ